jgi:hypothetical protein
MTEARKAYVRILVRSTDTNVKFIIADLAGEPSLLNVATKFAGRSPVQNAHFSGGVIKKIGLPHIHDLFG